MTRLAVLLMMITTPLMASTLVRGEPVRNNGPVWIDVRSAQEYQQDHLPGAVLIPFTRIARGVSEQYPDRNTSINLYGADGVRSRMAMEALQALGYSRVEDLGSLNAIRGTEPATVTISHTADSQ
ncbi:MULTISPECIES: rhodanese-like domain-containing protein [Oceanimonas]|uniref:Rhodanese-like domain-containing protein n=1 Tax=Oceanimonas smirnovii TaxID=264574 RepID=A0ABW7NX27_9GAMM